MTRAPDANPAPPPAGARHPHLATPRTPGRLRVDMHLHTMWSGDAQTTPDELAAAVADTGLDVLCITDHSEVKGAQRLADSGELGCRVVVGQELRTGAGEIIGLFLSERLPFGLSPDEACRAIRDQGGLVYIPHPFDRLRHALRRAALERLVGDGHVDAIEVWNAKVRAPAANRQAAEFAAAHGLAAGAASDAHEPSAIGAAYVEMAEFTDSASFLASLRHGAICGHHYDVARTWRPRVIPSTSL